MTHSDEAGSDRQAGDPNDDVANTLESTPAAAPSRGGAKDRRRRRRRSLVVGIAGVAATAAAVTVTTLGTDAPAGAANNDYMSDPDCANNGIPAEIVTKDPNGWRFSASCWTSYTDVDGKQVPGTHAYFDAVLVSGADVDRSARIRYMCPERKGALDWDQGTLRGFAADGSEVFRVYPTRASQLNLGLGDPARCSNDN